MNAALLLFSLFAYCPARDAALSFEAGCLACTADAAASISILQASPRQGHKLVSLGPSAASPFFPPPSFLKWSWTQHPVCSAPLLFYFLVHNISGLPINNWLAQIPAPVTSTWLGLAAPPPPPSHTPPPPPPPQ